jgi:hypothetical protein
VAERPFDPSRILEVLQRHDVAFVVIGAVAAIAQGYPLPTEDIDVTPARDPENLERLAAALVELGAKLRLPDGGGLEFPIEARLLAGNESWTLTTRFGPLDLVFMPAGTRGYDDLRKAAIELELGAPVLVAALADVIRTKEAAGRLKDQAQLPALRQTLEVIREREAREKG